MDEDFTLAVSFPSLDDLLLRAVPVSLLAEDTKKSLIPSKLDFRLLTPGLDSTSVSSDSAQRMATCCMKRTLSLQYWHHLWLPWQTFF